MEVSVKFNPERWKRVSENLRQIPDEALEEGGDALYDYLVEYHSKTDWKEGNWFSGYRSGEFRKEVIEGWQNPTRSGNTITIRNTFGLLKWKTTGGVIAPVRAKYLTIPLIPEARHRLQSELGYPLFKAGMALCRRIGKRIEAVYALSLGVSQNPYPDAMPKHETLQRVARVAIQTAIRREVS